MRDLKAHYDKYYDGRSEWRELGAVGKADNVIALWNEIGAKAQPRVLEVGCGEGAVLARLGAEGFSVRGVELSATGAAAARKRNLDVDLYDGSELPYEDRRFDLAVLTHVVEHVANPRAVLAEAGRVADWVFVEVPLEYGWRTKRDFEWTSLGHINLYDRKLARHLLQSSSLEVLSERFVIPELAVFHHRLGRARGTFNWTVRQLADRLARPAAHRLFTYHGAFLCRVQRESGSPG